MLLSGLYGYVHSKTGRLNAIGFIEHDTACTNTFINQLGRAKVTWVSPLPGVQAVPPTVNEGLSLGIPVLNTTPSNSKKVDTALIVICALVYAFLFLTIIVFIV